MTENHKRTIHPLVNWTFEKVGEDGFEPPKALPTDLQSAPFGHSGTLPGYVLNFLPALSDCWADGGIRTPDQLITNQLLWPTELHRQSLTLVWGCKYMRKNLFRKTSRQKIYFSSFFVCPRTSSKLSCALNLMRRVQNRGQKYNSFLYKKIIEAIFSLQTRIFHYLCDS